MGANVIKVEPPDGDNLRNYPSTLAAECRFFVGVNRGKRSIVLNLKEPAGLEVLTRLISDADVLVHNFRPGVAERLGFGYGQLAQAHPRLIYAALTAFGEDGPLRSKAGFDQVLQAWSGLCVGQGEAGGRPALLQGSIVDYFSASMLAMSIAGALYEREKSGFGQRISVSMLAAALCLQAGRFVWAEGEDANTDRHMRSTGVNGIFPTLKGHLYLQASTPHFWKALCSRLDCDDLAEHPDYDTVRKRVERKDEIAARVQKALLSRTAEEWEIEFADKVPCAVVRTIESLFDDDQVLAQGVVAEYSHATVGKYRGFRGPAEFHRTPLGTPCAAPALGQHTHEILKEASYAAEDIDRLVASGVVK